MDVLDIKPLMYYWRHCTHDSELYERFDWRDTAPDMHWSFTDTLCAYTASPHATMADNRTYIPYDCILHTK